MYAEFHGDRLNYLCVIDKCEMRNKEPQFCICNISKDLFIYIILLTTYASLYVLFLSESMVIKIVGIRPESTWTCIVDVDNDFFQDRKSLTNS